MKKIITGFILCLILFTPIATYAQRSGSRSYSRPSTSRSRFSSSKPGANIAKARAAQQSRSAKSPIVTSNRLVAVNRQVRIHNVYHGYPTTYHSYHYNDSFNPMLTGLLIGRLMDNNHHTETVRYVYNNWDNMDAARREQLLRENVGLKAELDKLNGTPRDPKFALSGVDQDLLYVKQESYFWWYFFMIGTIIFLCIFAYLFFFKEWK